MSIDRLVAIAIVLCAFTLAFGGGYPLAYGLMAMSIFLIVRWLTINPALKELKEPAGLLMLAAFVLIAIAAAATAQQATDLAGVVSFTMVALFPLLRAATARFSDRAFTRWVSHAALVGSAVSFAVAAAQVNLFAYGRAQGFGSDPIWAAQAALSIGFLALIGLREASGLWRYALPLGPGLGIATVLLTGSRGPLIATVPLLVIAVLASPGARTRTAVSAIVAAIFAGFIFDVIGDAGRIATAITAAADLLAEASIGDSSIGIRVTLFEAAWEAFLNAPIAGHGWEQRVAVVYQFVAGGEQAIVSADAMMQGNRHLHADMLDFGVAAGLLGLVAYGLILIAPIVGALSSPQDSQRPARILGTVLLSTSYFFCGLSYIMLGYEFPTTLYVVTAAILLGGCRDQPSHPARRQVSP